MRRVDPLRFHLAFCTPTPFCTSCWSKGGRRKPDASCKNRGHPIYACRSILELENDMKGLLSKTQTVTVLNQTAFHWQYLSRPGTCYATDHRRIYPHVNFVEDDKRLARSVFPSCLPTPSAASIDLFAVHVPNLLHRLLFRKLWVLLCDSFGEFSLTSLTFITPPEYGR